MEEVYKNIIEKIDKNRVYINEPMSKHTTFKVGGKADLFIKIETLEELKYVLNIVKEFKMPLTIIGNGSNLLVKDGRNKRNNC